jgi:predicted TPR repeat methyltransferase
VRAATEPHPNQGAIMPRQTPELWKATYKAESDDELLDAYRDWAHLYDKDTCDGMGYVGPKIAASRLDQYLDSPASRILDAGCGTGLVGEVCRQLGYSNLEATDFSQEMLDQAESKRVYTRCYQADLNQGLQVADNSYDATICVGTFTYAHVGPEAFAELVRVTRPGGYVSFTIRDGAYQEYGYRDKMLEMEAENDWELLEMIEEDYLVKEKVTAKFCTYRVLD